MEGRRRRTQTSRFRACGAVAAGAVALLASPVAHAEEAFFVEGYSAPRMPLRVETAESSLSVQIYGIAQRPGRDEPLRACRTPCQVDLEAGRYWIVLEAAPGSLRGTRRVEVSKPTRVTLSPRDPTWRWVGLSLGVTGPPVIGIGFFWLLMSSLGECPEASCDQTDERIPIGLMIGGAVSAAVGWTLFVRSFRPGIDVEALPERRAPQVRVTSGPRGTAGLGISVGF